MTCRSELLSGHNKPVPRENQEKWHSRQLVVRGRFERKTYHDLRHTPSAKVAPLTLKQRLNYDFAVPPEILGKERNTLGNFNWNGVCIFYNSFFETPVTILFTAQRPVCSYAAQ